ncbi:HIT domain-containing protein [Candidatus Curtissbacteria bacterium]|nr:HIT domain-containing protein [Candidatus Curtissbacteria bacterium]
MTNKDCIFCKIVSGEVRSNIVYEAKRVIAFPDINPIAATHILIVPKKHIESAVGFQKADTEDVMALFGAAKKLVDKNSLDAYRLAFNGGKFQHVPHLHMHLVAGKKIEWSKL